MTKFLMSLVTALSLGLFAQHSNAAVIIEGDSFTYTENVDFIISDNLAWTWASPCAGSCSQLVNPLPDGWRFATILEFATRPDATAFLTPLGRGSGQGAPGNFVCTSNIFDPVHNHCDWSDGIGHRFASTPNNTSWETLLVHDLLSVPAPGALALLGLGLFGLTIRRRTI